MIRVKCNVSIHRPIEAVFHRLVDINGYPDWLPPSRVFLDCYKTSEGPEGIGTTFIDRTKIGSYHGVITTFERPLQVGFRMTLKWLGMDVMVSRPEYQLEPDGDKTKVHHLAEGELYGIFKILEPYVANRAHEERIRTVRTIKTSLEL